VPLLGFRLPAASLCLPPACAKVFADTNGVIAPPGTVRSKVSGPEITIPCSKAVKKEVLGHAHFEAPPHVDGGPPGVLDPDSVEGPSVQVLGNISAEQEAGLCPEHESAKRSPAKRPNFQNAGKHVSRKCVTGCSLPTVIPRIRGAQVGIDFVVRRSDFELRISPKRILRQEKAFLSILRCLLSLETQARSGHNE
jgi:hypothetical protein